MTTRSLLMTLNATDRGGEAQRNSMTCTTTDRILACLQGIATGDAVGKQTETLAPNDVSRWYPNGVRGFEGTPGDVIPRYARTSKRQWRIGETTDDTERTIAVARAISADNRVSHASVGRELLRCVKCVHPGIPSLWEFHQAADRYGNRPAAHQR